MVYKYTPGKIKFQEGHLPTHGREALSIRFYCG